MSILVPENLKSGDTIAIVSTARKISKEELQPAINLINDYGYKVKLGEHLFNEYNQFSGTDEERAKDLQNAFEDKTVSAILCARGGYGTIRILSYLDPEAIKNNPKWLIGYSDVTVLHALLHEKLSIASLHASMPINFASYQKDDLSMTSLFDALRGKTLSYRIESHKKNRLGDAEGILIGGNLSMIYSLRGTELDFDTNGKVLFIEDLDEYLYHIDRIMMNLKLGGKLDNLKALIVGGLSDMNDNTVPFGKTAKEIVWEAVKDYNYPVVFDFPAGHIHENYALPMGKRVELTVASDGVVLKI